MVSRALRPIALMVIAAAITVGMSAPLTANNSADASGDGFDVGNWSDPDDKDHRIRWNPCQPAVTFAVNAKLAGGTASARDAAVADTRAAFKRVSNRTGIPFSFAGRTAEIPTNGKDQSWSDRQKSAEIVVAWVNQSRAKFRTNLMSDGDGGYPSGVGGWMMRAWTNSDGNWQAAIGRGFVVLNAAHNSTYKAGFGSGVTRGALLLHEIGHVVGLGHVGSTAEIMYPTMLDRQYSRYKTGDRAGLSRVGKSLGCISGASDAWPQI
ncbi:MAG: matrixin family metalloprotease [Actinomycetia bacterium]|nr:matrixin family metalloprotease [Actinomycetes bacterium]